MSAETTSEFFVISSSQWDKDAALADGGDVFIPLGKTFFSPCFGI